MYLGVYEPSEVDSSCLISDCSVDGELIINNNCTYIVLLLGRVMCTAVLDLYTTQRKLRSNCYNDDPEP